MSTESQLKIPIEKRKERARAAAIAKNKKYFKESEERVNTANFNDLNSRERRLRLMKEQNNSCLMCNNSEWLGNPITLELDHINGDRSNEERDNLRLLCPNCHSQTDTYKTLNRKYSGNKQKVSNEIILEALKQEKSIYKVLTQVGLNPHGGNYTRVRKLIKEHNLQGFIF
jgi:5-methylcytosine-specific restriction endonuclease McrA